MINRLCGSCGIPVSKYSAGLCRACANAVRAKAQRKYVFGLKIERLTVIEVPGGIMVKVRCDCGSELMVQKSNLTRGATKSCGCLAQETRLLSAEKGRAEIARKAKHHQKLDEFWIWSSMIKRCHLVSDKKYHLYGGRGISVCERWRSSFDNFLLDMGSKPFANATLDRKNNDGPYSPENCVWATYRDQSRNRRNNVNIEFQGETMCKEDWAKRIGISPDALSKRLKRWTLAEALTRAPTKGRS